MKIFLMVTFVAVGLSSFQAYAVEKLECDLQETNLVDSGVEKIGNIHGEVDLTPDPSGLAKSIELKTTNADVKIYGTTLGENAEINIVDIKARSNSESVGLQHSSAIYSRNNKTYVVNCSITK